MNPYGWQQAPPPPPKRSTTPWLIGGAAAVVVVVVLAVLLVQSTKAQPELSASWTGPAIQETDAPTTPARPKIAGAPATCATNAKFGCMPDITDVGAQVTPQLRAKGFSCHQPTEQDSDPTANLSCETQLTSANQRQMSVNFEAPDLRTDDPDLADFEVYGTAAEWGATTDLSADSWSQEKQVFDDVLSIVFAQDSQLRQELDNWADTHVPECGTSKPTASTIPAQDVDGYTITCQAPVPISVSGSKGTYTNFHGGLDVQVDQFAR
jgi:hypothetical protein